MTRVVVVGDGPAGLSAALFLAKNGLDVTVMGQDRTAMHFALLHNYLGIEEMLGTDFQKIARKQVAGYGAQLLEAKVVEIQVQVEQINVVTEDETTFTADFLVLAEGRTCRLARALELAETEFGITVDINGRTSTDRIYAVGRMTRLNRSQAIISAGQGAAAAVDILSRHTGEEFRDWDEPPKAE